MLLLKEFLARVEELAQASPLEPYLKHTGPEYLPEMGSVFGEVKFEMGRWHEGVTIKYELRPTSKERLEDADAEEGRTKIRQPYKKESAVVVYWNRLSDRTVSEAVAALDLFNTATKLAARIEHLIDSQTIVDFYWELEAPPRPSEIDRWATYKTHPSEIRGTVDDLKKTLRNLDLKVSGNKEELQQRLFDYVKQHGNTEKAKRYDVWIQNRFQATA